MQGNMTQLEDPGDWFDLSGFEITTQQIDRYRGQLPVQLNLVAKFGSGRGKTHGVAPGWLAPDRCPNPTSAGGCDWRKQDFAAADKAMRTPWVAPVADALDQTAY